MFTLRSTLSLVSAAFLSLAAANAQQTLLTARHIPAAVTSGQAKPVGEVEAAKPIHVSIALPLRNRAEMQTLLHDMYDRNSPQWHKFLKKGEFAERFGPTQADYDKLITFAKRNGLAIRSTFPQRTLITVDAPASTVERVFHVKLLTYQHPTEARTFFAPDREPTVDLGIPVLDIRGLDSYYRNHPHSRRGTAGEAKPGAAGTGPNGAYLPQDMRAAYYGLGSLTGKGQKMDIVSFDGYQTSDVTLFYSGAGLTQTVPVTNVYVDNYNGACSYDGAGDGPCDDGEQTLDIVNASAMAPGMDQIYFYEVENSNSDPSLPLYTAIAAADDAQIISSSWSGDPNNTAEEDELAMIAMQGQTMLNASGDSGAYNDDTWEGFPGGEPLVVEVGATTLTTASQHGSQFVTYGGEVGWSHSGGGIAPSDDNPQAIPAYQQIAGVISAANGGSTTYRNAPDLAMEGDFDNYIVNNGITYYDYGGTSFATPRWAGYMALMNEQSNAESYGNIGAVETDLYDLGTGTNPLGGSILAGIYNDVTSGSNPANDGSNIPSYNAVAGYDLVTGWGSPNNGDIIDTLAPTVTVLPVTGTQADTFTITYSQPEATGAATSLAISPSFGLFDPGDCTFSSGKCSISVPGSTFGPGKFEVSYSYMSGGQSIPTQSLGSGTVTDELTTSITSSASVIGPSQMITFTATATDTSYPAQVLSGAIDFIDNNSSSLGSCTITSGSCSLTVAASSLAAGSNVVVAQPGAFASIYNVTSIGSVTVRLTGANLAGTVITASPNPAAVGQTVVVSATVSGSAGIPTGAVHFYLNNTLVDTIPLDGSGVASDSVATAGLPAGTYSIAARYTGDTTYQVSGSGPYRFTLNKNVPVITLSASPNSLSVGQFTNLLVTVTGPDGPPAGEVKIFANGETLAIAGLTSGIAAITLQDLGYKPGSYSLTAAYSGSSSYTAAASAAVPLQITRASTSTTLNLSPSTVIPPNSVTATAIVARTSSGATGAPGGSVNFLVNGKVIGSASLSGGVATLTETSSGDPGGTDSITAVYVGDEFDSASTSPAASLTVQ